MGDGAAGSSGGGISEFGSLGGGFCPGDPMPESGAGAEGSPGVGGRAGLRLLESPGAFVEFVSLTPVATEVFDAFVSVETAVGELEFASFVGARSEGEGEGFS